MLWRTADGTNGDSFCNHNLGKKMIKENKKTAAAEVLQLLVTDYTLI